MKSIDQALQRLFDSAGQAQSRPAEPMSFTQQSRIMAGWRSIRPQQEELPLIDLLRRAVALGSIIMILTLGASWSYSQDASVAAIEHYASIELVP